MNREVTFTMKDMIRQGVLSKLVAGESTMPSKLPRPPLAGGEGWSERGQDIFMLRG